MLKLQRLLAAGAPASFGLALATLVPGPAVGGEAPRPNVVVVSIDTLRADRLSAYGYERATSPNLDRAMAGGIRFTQARTVEPLTSPALCSMITSRYPHEHGSSRNGLRMRDGLPSLPKMLRDTGYRTAAFVGNWTLRDKLSGLAEHFDDYEEVMTRRRWFGLVNTEADAEDLTVRSLAWLEDHVDTRAEEPFFLWVHYTEPHAPYRLHKQYVEPLGIERRKRGKVDPTDRYDTEIAFVDESISRLLAGLAERVPTENTLLILTSDHGESLGEHDYWGHGRHLYEPTLHIPMAIAWPGHLEPGTIDAPALIIDLAPTIASLLELEGRDVFRGYDWTDVFEGETEPPHDRITAYQAHRGAVFTDHDSDLARRSGLLSVALIRHEQKEIFRLKGDLHYRFDLRKDPLELSDLVPDEEPPNPTEALQDWMALVSNGLHNLDEQIPEPLDDETIERLRALGYAD